MDPVEKRFKFDPSKYPTYVRNLQLSQINFNKEQLRLRKEELALEREHRRNGRKYDAARRGVCSMLGKTFYPDSDKDHTLFQHNVPGFCYDSNGNPRYFKSLAESKTRKIVHDLDGKNGLFLNMAANVVSDSPVLTEILSSPDMRAILCELRTTATLLADKDLFSQFAMSLVHNPNNPIPMRGGNSLDCLTAYRRHLIKTLFNLLQLEIAHRNSSSPRPSDVDSRLLLKISKTDEACDCPCPHQLQHNSPRCTEQNCAADSSGHISKQKRPEPTASSLSAFLLNPGGYRTIRENFPPSQITILPPDTPSSTSVVSLSQSDKIARAKVQFEESLKKKQANYFIKALLKDVENIAEVERTMGRLQRKRPRYNKLTDPLLRLLKNENLVAYPLATNMSASTFQDSRSKKTLEPSNQKPLDQKSTEQAASRQECNEQKAKSTAKSSTLLNAQNQGNIVMPDTDSHKSATDFGNEWEFFEQRDDKPKVEELSGPKEIKSTDWTDSKTDCGSESGSSRSYQTNALNRIRNKYMGNLKTRSVAAKHGKLSTRWQRQVNQSRATSTTSSKRIAFTRTYEPNTSSIGSRNSFGSVSNFSGYKLHSQTSSTNRNALFRELSVFIQKSYSNILRGTSEKSVSAGPTLESRRVFGSYSPTNNTSNLFRALDANKWTLRVDTSDLVKLRHELQDGATLQRVSEFENSWFV